MFVSEKIMEETFVGRTTKDAYLNACKWISTNIIAKNNSKNITYKIEKVKTEDLRTKVKVTVYVTIDEGEIQERHCNICEETNSLFYMSKQKHRCESCNMIPYRKRMIEKLSLIKESVKGII